MLGATILFLKDGSIKDIQILADSESEQKVVQQGLDRLTNPRGFFEGLKSGACRLFSESKKNGERRNGKRG